MSDEKRDFFRNPEDNYDEIVKAEEMGKEFNKQLVGLVLNARKVKGMSQQDLAEISGIKQTAIARFERSIVPEQFARLFKLLRPLGYKLDIVPLKEDE